MKGSDKILILIVGLVLLLVAGAFALVLLRPQPEYMAEESPEGVVHNYLLALRRGDYERAYDTISQDAHIDDLDDFIDSVEKGWAFDLGNDVELSVEETNEKDETARVKVRKTRTYNDLFGGSQYSDTFSVRLKKYDGEWKITDSDSYWDNCWDKGSNCNLLTILQTCLYTGRCRNG